MKTAVLVVLACVLLARAPLEAQQTAAAPERRGGWSALRIAKWSTLALSAGAAVIGFTTNARADDLYEALERDCVADPATCRLRTPEGAYRSEDLERRYQDVLDRDQRARNALLASQIGVATSVVLFILDLRNARGPEDVIYRPKSLQVSPRRDGGVELRLHVPTP